MNELISQTTSQHTMSSLQIAELTSKRHDAILRDIRNLLEQGVNAHNFVAVEYTDRKGESRPCYQLTKTGCLILASGYNALLREKIINRWEELEILKSSNQLEELTRARIFAVQFVKQELRLNDASYLGMLHQVTAPLGLTLPNYVKSEGAMKPVKDLLLEMGKPMSAVAFNKLLVKQGYLETLSRTTSNGGRKPFQNITDKGKPYGQNMQSKYNQKETQPYWYIDKFKELYSIVTA